MEYSDTTILRGNNSFTCVSVREQFRGIQRDHNRNGPLDESGGSFIVI